MSYQRIATPKVYIDNINWLMSSGQMSASDFALTVSSMATGSSVAELFDMKPSNLQTISTNGNTAGAKIRINTNITSGTGQDANFIAILGHNLKEAGARIMVQEDSSSGFASPYGGARELTEVVNCPLQSDTNTGVAISGNMDSDAGTVTVTMSSANSAKFTEGDMIKINSEIMYVDSVASGALTVDRRQHSTSLGTHSIGDEVFFTKYSAPTKNGWSLATYATTPTDNQYIRLIIEPDGNGVDTFSADVKIGAILIGEVYEFPQVPDLKINKQFSFDGVKRQTSIGGQTYANATYLKGANWFLEPFYNSATVTAPVVMGKSGRMSLDMSFSYLDDSDIFNENLYGGTNVTTNNKMYANIISKTHNGMHPMLFQYDKDTATDIDSFLWCRLANDPKFAQVANRVWSTKMSLIEEF